MSDTAAKTPTKKVELPKIKGRASEVLAAEPKASLRQLAADNTNKKTFKNISGVLDRFVSYSRTPVDRTTDIEIQSVQAETTEALETTSLVLNLSTKHIDEQNKLLEDILKVIKDKEKSSDESKGGGSILDGLLDVLDGAGKKGKTQRKYSTEREKKARQRLRQTKSAVKPPATSVAKPPVAPARPTVPQVTAPPATSVSPARPTVPEVAKPVAPATSVAKPPSVLSSITEKIKSLKPSVSNIISGATSIGKGLATGVATDVALSSLTGKDEGISSLALGFVPAAAGTVIATSGIKQAFAAAEALTPEERKGVDVRPETLDKILKNELNIEIVNEKELAPFKAGQVVSAQTIAKEYDIASPEELKATIESLIKSGSGSNIKVKITTESEKEKGATPQTPNERPLSDAFRERYQQQETNPPPERQRRSSLSDGSYQVASAVPTVMSDAIYITDEPEIKLASDVKDTGEKIVDLTGKSASVINETVKDINEKQIQKATDSVDKLKTEVKKQNKAYETLNDVMTFFGIKRKVAEQSNNTDTEDTPDTTPQVQATQNIQQLQSQVAQAPVSSGFSSGFSRMAGLAAGFMGATAAVASVGRPSRGGSSGANRIAAGSIGSMGGAAVMGAMMQPQLSGGSVTSTSGTASAVAGPAATNSTSGGSDQSKGGEQPSGDFMTEVGKVASNLGVDTSNLIAIMKSESSLNPQAVNPVTGASGLIQFMPNTAKSLGTTVEEIRKMTAVQQLPYVEKYFKSVRVQPGSSAGRLYAYVFLPGRANREVLTQAGENYYESNKGLDIDRDGKITIADLDARLAKYGGSISASLQGAKPASGSSLSAASTSMEASDQAQMRGAGQALQGTTAPAPSTGPQGMQMPPSAMGMGEIPINIRLRQLQS